MKKNTSKDMDMDAVERENKTEIDDTQYWLERLNKSKWAAIDLVACHKASPPLCRLCGYTGENFLTLQSECMFGGGKLLRVQCPICDCISGPEKMFAMTPELLKEDYEFLYKYYSEGDTAEGGLRTFAHLNSKPKGIYLDYGAGNWSKTLSCLQEKGFNVWGYEPHATVTTSSASIITSEEKLKAFRFDGIFSVNVLEHFVDPIQALIEMRHLLKPGGTMAHATPCFDYKYEYTRFHLFFFPGRAAQVLAEKAGLRIIREENDGEYMVRVFEPISVNNKSNA